MRTLAVIILTFFYFLTRAQRFIPIDTKSHVNFTIRNFGITVQGTFQRLAGDIHFDPLDLESSYFNASVHATTINSGIDLRDKHLRQEEYFDVSVYPLITFESKRIKKGSKDNEWFVTGDLTIKKITNEVAFIVRVNRTGENILFHSEFSINRRDYNVGGRSLSLADMLIVKLDVFAENVNTN